MARPKVEVSRAFAIMEATSAPGGGFPAYMNTMMAEMVEEMKGKKLYGPYRWSFSGGDGYAVPVHFHCEQ